jgi:hypothetical protein
MRRKVLVRCLVVLALLAASMAPTAVVRPPRASATIGNLTYQFAEGFDTCTHMTPSQLSDWWAGTPWWHVGLYLGGSNGATVGCSTLGSSTFNYAVNLGFGVIPYWYGPQMPTSCGGSGGLPSYISLNTTTAYNQGVAEATSAGNTATSYGLGYDGIVYFDLEGFVNNSGCLAAEQAFVNGWDYQMSIGTLFWPGLYGSSCSSHLTSLGGASISHIPYAISVADYNRQYNTVYGLLCLPDSQWNNDHRNHQFVQEEYLHFNSTYMYVDEDCADTLVDTNRAQATLPNDCRLIVPKP